MTTWEERVAQAAQDIDHQDATRSSAAPAPIYSRQARIAWRAVRLQTLADFDAYLNRSSPADHPAFYRQDTP